MTPDVMSHIDAYVESAMRRQHLPGVGLAVGSDGTIAYARGYGARNVPDGLPLDEHTIFKIASVSKQFTAAAIMLGVEQGRVALNDPLQQYFPALPFPRVQIVDLLRHTSGIPGYSEAADFEQVARTSATPDEIIARIAEQSPSFAPATDWEYSNSNYVLLARLAERLFDATYRDIVRDRLCKPADLPSTDVDDLTTLRPGRAEGYSRFALGDLERAHAWNPSWEYGTGGLISTASDLIRWNAALRSGRVVNAESFAQMSTAFRLPDGRSTNYGFGLVVRQIGDMRELRHLGGLPGFSLDNASYPDRAVDIVVLTNMDSVYTYHPITRPILAGIVQRDDLIVPVENTSRPISAHIRQTDVLALVETLQDGRVDALRPTPSLRRALTPLHRAHLESLRRFGRPLRYELIDWFARPPQTFFGYDVQFQDDRLIVGFGRSDDDELSGIYLSEYPDIPKPIGAAS